MCVCMCVCVLIFIYCTVVLLLLSHTAVAVVHTGKFKTGFLQRRRRGLEEFLTFIVRQQEQSVVQYFFRFMTM